jgi:uncharacterized membrane protein
MERVVVPVLLAMVACRPAPAVELKHIGDRHEAAMQRTLKQMSDAWKSGAARSVRELSDRVALWPAPVVIPVEIEPAEFELPP